TNLSGTDALANAVGVILEGGATGNTIGGTAAGMGNVISGNTGDGVQLNGTTTTGNLVQGNFIGTDVTGEAPIGNTGAGVDVINPPANTIGGPVGGARNVLSANAEGVLITGSSTTGILVAGNLIGTDANGATALGNLTAGVVISAATGTTLGGTTTLA